jgi:hypothetical protein
MFLQLKILIRTYTRMVRKAKPLLSQNFISASSNSRSGPVVPIMTNGWPASKWKIIPTRHDAINVSEIPIKFPVLSEAKPPNVMAVESAAKYIKTVAAKVSVFNPSLISLLYIGKRRLTSFIKPPHNLLVFSNGFGGGFGAASAAANIFFSSSDDNCLDFI